MDNSNLDTLDIFYYVSEKANTYTPAKTIFVCAPAQFASEYKSAQQFAETSGWLRQVEEDGAVLVMPLVKNGWANEPVSLIPDIYAAARQKFKSKQGDSIPGRDGFVWCWETIIYLVGYDDGAVFAGNTAVAYPNRFAGIVLIDGVPDNYSSAEAYSDHWLVPDVSSDYNLKNSDIPVCIWIINSGKDDLDTVKKYFCKVNRLTDDGKEINLGGISTRLLSNESDKAAQLRLSITEAESYGDLPKVLMEKFFNKFIRWKNSPDGTPKPCLSKYDFYNSSRFIKDSVSVEDRVYDYFTYLPDGVSGSTAKNMPVVFSVHGRGEPSWIFSTKNGWDKLADETKEFILVLPDSPQNIWLYDRDNTVFSLIIDELFDKYEIDKSRVYMTGFSNGAMLTREMANYQPELFAAVSPWSGPFVNDFRELLESDYEIPCMIFTGDNDAKVPLGKDVDSLIESMLKVNHCNIVENDSSEPLPFKPDLIHDESNTYTEENGYTDGDRMKTYWFCNQYGEIRVGYTLLKNMPHGAVYDQSRAAWTFLKQFSRKHGEKKVELNLKTIF